MGENGNGLKNKIVSNGIFKIDGRVLDIDTISLKPDLNSELGINDVYAESYEIYKGLKRVAPEHIITHWEESYGVHIEGLGHKKVLIEKYNDGYNNDDFFNYTFNWHDTGEYVDYLSGCPHCNPDAVKVDDYINKHHNIPEITRKARGQVFTGYYTPHYYLDTELFFPYAHGIDTNGYGDTVDLYADPAVIEQVIYDAMMNRPKLGDLNHSVSKKTCYEGEEITINASCKNAHHIYVRVVDQKGNTVYQKTEDGSRFSNTITLDKGGIYSIYAAARNTNSDQIDSDFKETAVPEIVTVKYTPEIEVVNTLDKEIEVRLQYPINNQRSNTFSVYKFDAFTETWKKVENIIAEVSMSYNIKNLTPGGRYKLCMQWVENGELQEITEEIVTPVTQNSGKYGDVNGDETVDSTDYALFKRYNLGIMEFQVKDGSAVADVNADGIINTTDYAFMKRYNLGLIDSFPAEKFLNLKPQVELINRKDNEIYVAEVKEDGTKVLNIMAEGTNCHHVGLFMGKSKGQESFVNHQDNIGLSEETFTYHYDCPVSQSGKYSIYVAGRNAHDTIYGSKLDKSDPINIDVIVPGSYSSTLKEAQDCLNVTATTAYNWQNTQKE